jgi:mono/diheme cytochrome c family protein
MSAIPSATDPRLEPAAASDESIQRVHGALLGQKPEPEPGGYTLAPLALLGFMSALILFAGIFMVHNSGGFSPLVQNGLIDPAQIGNGPVVLDNAQIVARGRSLYIATCLQCHGPEGKGSPGAYPPLAGVDLVTGSEERLVRILLQGLKDPIKLNGVEQAYPNKMPSLIIAPHNFSDAKIAQVATFIRQEWGNQAPPVSEEKVREIREQTKSRTTEWTFGELPAN